MVPKTCAIEECDRNKYCRGWCKMHYTRWLTHGDPAVSMRPVAKTCAVEDCGLRQHAHGYCPSHLYHVNYYGDPLAVGPGKSSGRNRMAVPSYAGMHKRLFYDKGRASAHSCVDCGGRAQEWSYDGGCPNELHETLEKLPIAYSLDQSRYSPRCKKCHRTRDESLNRPRGADGRFVA